MSTHLLNTLFIATARRFAPIRRTILINQIINKRIDETLLVPFLDNTPSTWMKQLHQFLAANRTQRFSFFNFGLQFPIAKDAEPSARMRTLNIGSDSRMIQLIISGSENRLALTHDLHDVPILLKASHFPAIEATTTTAVSAFVIAVSTSISIFDDAQDVKMGTPIPETQIAVAKAVKN